MGFNHNWLESADDFSRRHKRPLVTLSYAQSLDGSITVQRGTPLAVSGDQSLKITHQLRSAHDVILVGIGTVFADNPLLTARLASGSSPQPVVLDSMLRIPVDCRIIKEHPRKPWIGVSVEAPESKRTLLTNTGVKIFQAPTDTSGFLQLSAVLKFLYESGIKSIMVEGGARVITSFLRQRLVDHAVITIAAYFVGGLNVLDNEKRSQVERQQISRFPGIVKPQAGTFGQDILIWGEVQYP